MDLAWIFWDREKTLKKNPRQIHEQNPRGFFAEIRAQIRATKSKSMASFHPSSLCVCSLRCAELSDRETLGECPQFVGQGLDKQSVLDKKTWMSFAGAVARMSIPVLAKYRHSRFCRTRPPKTLIFTMIGLLILEEKNHKTLRSLISRSKRLKFCQK